MPKSEQPSYPYPMEQSVPRSPRVRAITVLLLSLMAPFSWLGCAPKSADDVASIAVIGDTQMMTEPAPREMAGKFADETSWLQANATTLRLRFVLQLGDLTNGTFKEGGYTTPATNTHGLTEIAYAKEAMDKLWRPANGPAIPWTVTLGNHDVDEWCWGSLQGRSKVSPDPRCSPGGVIINGGGRSRTTSNFAHIFPKGYFTAMPTWGGSSSDLNVNNNYHKLTIGDQSWLVVALMWAPQQVDFDWANTVISKEVAANPKVRVILATHGFMHPLWNGDPSRLLSGIAFGNARALYDNVIRLHPQIRLVLGGHWPQPQPREPDGQCLDKAAVRTFSPCKWVRKMTVNVPATDSVRAFTFHALLTDYSYNGNAQIANLYVAPTDLTLPSPALIERATTDNAFFRLLTFDSSKNTIRVRTITDPSNLHPGVPMPKGCASVSLTDLRLETDVCGKTDAAYGTSEDDYTLTYQ